MQVIRSNLSRHSGHTRQGNRPWATSATAAKPATAEESDERRSDAVRFHWMEGGHRGENAVQSPVNVMIVGQAGIGKSTLINAVLREPVADVGVGEPVTTHIEAHAVPGLPVAIYDTPGLELGDNVEDVAQEFLDVISERQQHSPTDHIHLLWFCIGAERARIQNFERDFIRALSRHVPCMVVLTQCLGDDEARAEELARSVSDAITKDRLDVVTGRPIKTLALPRKFRSCTVEPFGLDELVNASRRVLMPETTTRAFAKAFEAVPEQSHRARA